MPSFKYKVRDRSGKPIAGTLDAPNLEMAGERLYRLGYFPITIQGGKRLFCLLTKLLPPEGGRIVG